MSRVLLATVALAVLLSSACQSSSSTNVLGPGTTRCAMSLPANLPTLGPGGGTGTITVTVAAECVWRASSEVNWISITSNASGQGTGVVQFSASNNPTAVARRGGVIIEEARVELSQAGAPCQFTLTPQTERFGADGGEGTVSVSAIDGCRWSADSGAPWLSILGSASGTGDGSVRYRAESNGGAARTGTLTVADRAFAVNQSGTASTCAVMIGRSERSLPAAGGTDVVPVASAGACEWTAASLAPWITIASGANGTGNGSVTLDVAPNGGSLRVGLVTITGHTYVVTQAASAGGCSYSLGATGLTVPAPGGAGTVGVVAPGGCAWTAASQVSWITVSGGGSGSGNGSVTLAVAANLGAARSGPVAIAGQTLTVTQAAAEAPGCSYSLGSSDQSVIALGGPATVAVTASAGCSWTAASQVPWIAIAAGSSGSGNGMVVLNVGINIGPQRSATVTIAGLTHTITQAAAIATLCSYAVDPAALSLPAAGGPASIGVTTAGGCAWTASSGADWIGVADGTGSGAGVVQLNIASTIGAARNGIVTIAGQPVTVTQAAAACTYSLDPTSQTVPLLGGEFSAEITTQPWCTWSVAASVGWIQLASPTSGSAAAS